MNTTEKLHKVYSQWKPSKMEYRLQNDKTKFIPIETKKKFSVQLELFPEMQLKKKFPTKSSKTKQILLKLALLRKLDKI